MKFRDFCLSELNQFPTYVNQKNGNYRRFNEFGKVGNSTSLQHYEVSPWVVQRRIG